MTESQVASLNRKMDKVFSILSRVENKVDRQGDSLSDHIERDLEHKSIREQTCPTAPLVHRLSTRVDNLERRHNECNERRRFFSDSFFRQSLATGGAVIAALLLAKAFGI